MAAGHPLYRNRTPHRARAPSSDLICNYIQTRSPICDRTYMLKNYFTIAWRHLRKNKVYSAINISGLAIGMAIALLITLWIVDELSFDHYSPNHSRIAKG